MSPHNTLQQPRKAAQRNTASVWLDARMLTDGVEQAEEHGALYDAGMNSPLAAAEDRAPPADSTRPANVARR